MNFDFTGQTVLVTGATSGLGRATAQLFAAQGASVIATGRDHRRGKELISQIADAGGAGQFIPADLSSLPAVRELLAELSRGDLAVDILVNNAGVSPFVTTGQVTDELFREVFTINVHAPMVLVAGLAPGMAARGHGAIVNVTSLAADRGLPIMGLYGATKAALAALTRCWATEFGPAGIRVNAVSPSLVPTEGNAPIKDLMRENAAKAPASSTGHPRDVARAIAFLAAPGTSHIHGAILPLDGGMLASA
jgi:NAD(P)-dependent dehydrogenase (short-subunit alcohol dehydrogenase family)